MFNNGDFFVSCFEREGEGKRCGYQNSSPFAFVRLGRYTNSTRRESCAQYSKEERQEEEMQTSRLHQREVGYSAWLREEREVQPGACR